METRLYQFKYIKDLDIQWATEGSDVDFSKLPTDGLATFVAWCEQHGNAY